VVIAKSTVENYITEIISGIPKIYSDVTEEKGGSGKYFGPHDLLEAAFAACLNITARKIMDSMSVTYDGVTVKVVLDKSDEAKTVFKYQIDISGSVDRETRETVIRKVMDCPVKKTLSKPLEFVRTTGLG